MDKPPPASSSRQLAQRLYDKNIELENRRRKSAQARVPSDPNAWEQMRENFETIILEDHSFSEKHNIEYSLWQLHYKRIEEFRAHCSATPTTDSTASQTRGGSARPDRVSKIRSQFKTFLSEATGVYHDLILKIRAKYGLPMGQFYPEPENQKANDKDGKKSIEINKGLLSCHRCLIYLGDLARYKGLYGEGESKSRDYAAARSYYLQAASLWPASGNPHHQLAILANYSGDDLLAVYRYFRSLAAESPILTARDNLKLAFEKNRQSYTQLLVDAKSPSAKRSPVRTRGRGRGIVESAVRSKEPVSDASTDVERRKDVRQMLKAFRARFVRLNGILFTHTSLDTFEEILGLATNGFQELLSSGPEEELSFGTDTVENGLFIVILVSVLIFTVNNVKGGTEGQSYADIVQNTVLLKNTLSTFYELMGLLLKRCLQLTDPSSSFLLPGILVCVEWIACHPDAVIRNEADEKQSTAQINFWNNCVSLFNKLLLAGLVTYDDDDDDISCFTDMTRYEEGENELQPALWEDLELRGFLPLKAAQTFLDFSSKHSNSKKDKVARVKRILAAGKVIADKITIDHKKVRYDSNSKRFVIGVETKKDTVTGKSNGGVKEGDATAIMTVTPPKVESHVDFEDDDEVIVFKPTVIDNRTEMLAQKESHQEGLQHVQNKDAGTSQFAAPVSVPHSFYTNSQSVLPVTNFPQSIGQPYQFQSPVSSNNSQVAVSIAGGLKGLTLMENGHVGNHGMQRDMQMLNATGFRESGTVYGGTSHSLVGPSVINDANASFREPITHINTIAPSGPDPYTVGRHTFSTMPPNYLKGSTVRPVRHLGPPPGFNSVRPKQVNEQGSALGQNPLNDDYSWLDGYQLQASMIAGNQPINLSSNLSSQYMNNQPINLPSNLSSQYMNNQPINLPSNLSSQYMNNISTSGFPFPGRQDPTVQFEGDKQKNWQESAGLESSNSHHASLQQQYVPRMDQQGQPVWKGNQFV